MPEACVAVVHFPYLFCIRSPSALEGVVVEGERAVIRLAGSEEQDRQYSIEPDCYVADAEGVDHITHRPFADQMANQEMSTEPSEPRWWINEPSPAAICGHDEDGATNNKAESDEEQRRLG